MRKEIEQLEHQSRELEPDSENREFLERKVTAYSEHFYKNLHTGKTYSPEYQTASEILESDIPEHPENPEDLLDELGAKVDHPGINTASGGHLGYIPGGGLYSSALGDFLAAVTNRYAGVHYTSPGAVNMERRLIRWMADMVGYPDSAGGYLASGGSIANLTAIITAREARGLKAAQFSKSVVYVTEQTHHCIDRALRIAGMGEAIQRQLPVDENFRMKTDQLEQAIQQDLQAGRVPWLIVGSAGTTDTGAVDPLKKQGEIAARHGLWFHVDAAYGGFFMLTGEVDSLFAGIELSDSVVLDPHKGLFLPYGIGAVIVKQEKLMAAAYSYEASYMQDIQDQQTVLSPADTSPELSKHFRGLRMWLPLKLHGVSAFRSALKEKLRLAQHAHQRLTEMPGFETGTEPDLSVVLFRFHPQGADPDACTKKLHQLMLDDGQIYLSSTRIDGKYMLRLAVLSVRTHLSTIDLALELLQKYAREVTKSSA